ncbi:hypothetical protein OM416_20015 [Paenibacillus sp. LS1]|uniref:hypothetical protein n=1 Tax=Paenibacillus sp. LS1 TaxID=2992120 RepID=UPI002232B690|nr:hypothetical protein [Paenibacillus sp. LS1]MCW3793882.1 hypothetical protein [Paenibacillus sp. LS1]
MATIETCDFCYKESVLGCSGVGPQTEIGCIDVMGICPTCELSSLRSSIPNFRNMIEEYKTSMDDIHIEQDEYDYVEKSYFEAKDGLQERYSDQKYLANKVNNYYSNKYPAQVHPLNKSLDGNMQPGIYTNCSDGNLTIKMNLTTPEDRLVAEEYTTALGIPSDYNNEVEQVISI